MSTRKKFTESSGNVFEDIGFDRAEARALQLRSDLMVQLEKRLRAERRTQQQLGRLMGIGQSRVSDLLKGKAELFSLDMLVTLASRIGLSVGFSVPALPRVPPPTERALSEQSSTRELGAVKTFFGTSTEIVVPRMTDASTGTDFFEGSYSDESRADGTRTAYIKVVNVPPISPART